MESTVHLSTSRMSQTPRAMVMVLGDGIPQHLKKFEFGQLSNFRAELRRLATSGVISEVQFDAAVFHQGKNANSFLFDDAELGSFASSFKGAPFLADHEQRQIAMRHGTVSRSVLHDGKTFAQRVTLTDLDGIQHFINGKIDRFSIGFDAKTWQCTVCAEDIRRCGHWPGDTYEGKLCQILFKKPTGVETSAVNRPAVPGTGLLQVLSQIPEKIKMSGTQTAGLDTSLEGAANDEELELGSLDGVDAETQALLESIKGAMGLGQILERLTELEAAFDRIAALEQKNQELESKITELGAEPVISRLTNAFSKQPLPKAPSRPAHLQTKLADTSAGGGAEKGKAGFRTQGDIDKQKVRLLAQALGEE